MNPSRGRRPERPAADHEHGSDRPAPSTLDRQAARLRAIGTRMPVEDPDRWVLERAAAVLEGIAERARRVSDDPQPGAAVEGLAPCVQCGEETALVTTDVATLCVPCVLTPYVAPAEGASVGA